MCVNLSSIHQVSQKYFLKDFFIFYSDKVARPAVVAVKSSGESCNMQSPKVNAFKNLFFNNLRTLSSIAKSLQEIEESTRSRPALKKRSSLTM